MIFRVVDTDTKEKRDYPRVQAPYFGPDETFMREEDAEDKSNSTIDGRCPDHPSRGNPAGEVRPCHCEAANSSTNAASPHYAKFLSIACDSLSRSTYGFNDHKHADVEQGEVFRIYGEVVYRAPRFSIEHNQALQRNDSLNTCEEKKNLSQDECIAAFEAAVGDW